MAEDPVTEVRSSRRWSFIVGCFALGYPLSIGPAAWLQYNLDLPHQLFIVYWPIQWLAQEVDWLWFIYASYLSLFVDIQS